MRSSRSVNCKRMLGKKTMEAEILKEAVEIARSRKWIAHSPLLPGGRPVKLVSECLGVARSQLTVRIKQSVSPKSTAKSDLVDDTLSWWLKSKEQVSELPSYGYRSCLGITASGNVKPIRWLGDQCEAGLPGHA